VSFFFSLCAAVVRFKDNGLHTAHFAPLREGEVASVY
jgi:hypothetical protein